MTNPVQDLAKLITSKKNDDYVLTKFVQNVCYSSYNDVQYITGRISDDTADARELITNGADDQANTSGYNDTISQLRERIERDELQLNDYVEIHELAKKAHKYLTGKEWMPRGAKRNVSKKQATADIAFFEKRMAS